MTLKSKAAIGLAAAILATPLAVAPGAARADQMRIAIGQPETHSHSYGLNRYAEYLKANAGIDSKVYQMSLLSLSEIPNGLRDGIVGMGNVVTAYKPAEYSEFNLASNLSMLATLGDVGEVPAAAMSGAMMEYTLFDCPGCLDQFASQKQVFLGSASTSPYILLCREPVNTLADLKGKKLRSGAANFGRWATHVGGVQVSIPGNEIYDAMSQGVVDCAMLAVTTLIEASLIDVTKALHFGVPGGVFAGLADNAVNLDTWRGLTTEQRGAMIKGTAGLVADIVMYQRKTEVEALELAKSKGLTISSANAETMADYAAFVEGDMAVIAQEMTDKYAINDAPAKVAAAAALIEKWKGLTKDVKGGDVDGLAKIYWDELLSKLDPASYAMK